MSLGVEADDLEVEGVALLDHVPGMSDALVRQLADVDQSLEAFLDPDERAEVHQLGDGARDDVADLVLGDQLLPRIGLEASILNAAATTEKTVDQHDARVRLLLACDGDH